MRNVVYDYFFILFSVSIYPKSEKKKCNSKFSTIFQELLCVKSKLYFQQKSI